MLAYLYWHKFTRENWEKFTDFTLMEDIARGKKRNERRHIVEIRKYKSEHKKSVEGQWLPLDYFDESDGGFLYILPWFWLIQLPCNSGGEMIS
jgi:hypothetical protein